MRCAPAPRWALSFCAAACALLAIALPTARGQDTAAPAVAVATAAELAAAVDGGAAHIVVTEHLDLSDLPVFDLDGEPATDASFGRILFINTPSSLELASIRVRPSPHKVPVHLIFVSKYGRYFHAMPAQSPLSCRVGFKGQSQSSFKQV